MKALFYPDELVPKAKITYALKYLGIEAINDPTVDAELKFHWDYREINKGHEGWINGRCKNVEKWYVDKIFTEVFGYSSLIDTSRKGTCLRKDNKQGSHSGIVISTPVDEEEGFIYQKVIDTWSKGYYEVLRCIISYDEMLVVALKHVKRIHSPVFPRWDDSALTDNEKVKVIEFSKRSGMDFGELDVLRDKDNRIYIIDVNNIPSDRFLRNNWAGRDKFITAYINIFNNVCNNNI